MSVILSRLVGRGLILNGVTVEKIVNDFINPVKGHIIFKSNALLTFGVNSQIVMKHFYDGAMQYSYLEDI